MPYDKYNTRSQSRKARKMDWEVRGAIITPDGKPIRVQSPRKNTKKRSTSARRLRHKKY